MRLYADEKTNAPLAKDRNKTTEGFKNIVRLYDLRVDTGTTYGLPEIE